MITRARGCGPAVSGFAICVWIGLGTEVAVAQSEPLVLMETGIQERMELAYGRRPTLRDLRRAFPEYRIVPQRREAEAGGQYSLFCFSRWGPDRDCMMEWVQDEDGRVARIVSLDPRVQTLNGIRIGDGLRHVPANRLSECFTETGLVFELICELTSTPDGYLIANLDPSENHERPTEEQISNARVERIEVSFATEME